MSELKLEVCKKYTIVIIDSIMAMTHRQEITITQKKEIGGKAVYIYKNRGKRSEFIFDVGRGFVFEGWNVPFKVDTDVGGVMRGNACFNFVGDPGVIRDWIDNKNLNPNARKEIALVVDVNKLAGKEEELLYPELAEKSGHAVIRRLLNKE